MKATLLMLLWILSAPLLKAAPPRAAMKDTVLVSLIKKLQDTEGYTYNTTITNTLLSEPSVKKVEKMTTYSSLTDFVNYSRSEASLFFMCDRGQIRVDHGERTIYFLAYNDSSLNSAKKMTAVMRNTMQMDSFFLAEALVDNRKEQAGKVSYQLTYPETSMLRSMTLSYQKGKFFDKISYRVDRRAGYLTDDLVRQDVIMDSYVLGMPQEVRSLLAEKHDLTTYLSRTYPGYELKTL